MQRVIHQIKYLCVIGKFLCFLLLILINDYNNNFENGICENIETLYTAALNKFSKINFDNPLGGYPNQGDTITLVISPHNPTKGHGPSNSPIIAQHDHRNPNRSPRHH